MNVMIATLTKLWNGLGQFGVALRMKPYATRHPANVAVSAMMNSHIAIFFAGIEKAGFSITPECPPIATSAWLTVFLLIELQLHPKQPQQINPKHIHKMPIMRSCIERALPQYPQTKSANHPGQSTQAPQHVQCVRRRQHIKEGAVRVSSQVQSLCPQLQPRGILANDEQHAEAQRDVKPA